MMHRRTRTSVPALFAITLIALSSLGLSYAHWEKILYVDAYVKTGTLCAEFMDASNVKDIAPPYGLGYDWTCNVGFGDIRILVPLKNIGSTTVTLSGDKKTLYVALDNVYPCYYEEITSHIKNCGTIPWRITKVTFSTGLVLTSTGGFTLDIGGDSNADVELYWGDSFGDQIDPGEWCEVSFQIHVLQEAPQDTTLTFSAEIEVINWNEP